MIAVFTRSQQEFDELGLTPKTMFKRIVSDKNIIGTKFNGVIRCYRWYEYNKEIESAYEYLQIRQPELFKTKL